MVRQVEQLQVYASDSDTNPRRVNGALQLLINRHGLIRSTQVPERVSTTRFVVLNYRKLEVESLTRTGHL